MTVSEVDVSPLRTQGSFCRLRGSSGSCFSAQQCFLADRTLCLRFGRAIRRIREAQRINQEEAAERCGLHRTYYSGVERGIRNVSLVNVEKIAKGSRKSLPELFSRV